jgi:hypothetical protein
MGIGGSPFRTPGVCILPGKIRSPPRAGLGNSRKIARGSRRRRSSGGTDASLSLCTGRRRKLRWHPRWVRVKRSSPRLFVRAPRVAVLLARRCCPCAPRALSPPSRPTCASMGRSRARLAIPSWGGEPCRGACKSAYLHVRRHLYCLVTRRAATSVTTPVLPCQDAWQRHLYFDLLGRSAWSRGGHLTG